MRNVFVMTGACFLTASERSSTASGVIAPTFNSPLALSMETNSFTAARLTSFDGRNTPAFIISISAVPPASGRTVGSSTSSSATASFSDFGSASSNGVMATPPLEGGAQPRGELLLHLPCLGTQHRLAETAELACQRSVDGIVDPGFVANLGQRGRRCCGHAADDAERRALDRSLDLARRVRARHRDRDFEGKFHIGDLGLEQRGILVGASLGKVAHPVNAGREEPRIADLLVDRRARRLHGHFTGELHCARAMSRSSSAAMTSGTSSGVKCRAFGSTVSVEPAMP